MSEKEKTPLKVIARLRSGKVIRGFCDSLSEAEFENLLLEGPQSFFRDVTLRVAETAEVVSISLESLKAIFIVKSFDGNKEYKEVKFFESNPPIKGLWVRVRFYDNEHLEGIVANSLQFLTQPGFFLKPPDPLSNNQILYVVKDSLVEFSVLGVRRDY